MAAVTPRTTVALLAHTDMATAPESRPAESAEDAHAVAAVARALAEELQKQKQRTKEA